MHHILTEWCPRLQPCVSVMLTKAKNLSIHNFEWISRRIIPSFGGEMLSLEFATRWHLLR